MFRRKNTFHRRMSMVDRSIEKIDHLLNEMENLSPREKRKLSKLLHDAARATGLSTHEVTQVVGSLASAAQSTR